MRNPILVLLLFSLSLGAQAESNVFIAPDRYKNDPPVSGQVLGDNCSACHGTHGAVFNEIMPPLAGMDRDTFVKLMLDFKYGVRPTIVMNDVAKAYTEEEIRRMADYFSSLPAVPWKQQTLH